MRTLRLAGTSGAPLHVLAIGAHCDDIEIGCAGSGAPNLFVALDDAIAEAKVELLLASYPSQATRPWFTRDVFLGVMRLRGVQARVHFAEAFYARKVVLAAPRAGSR